MPLLCKQLQFPLTKFITIKKTYKSSKQLCYTTYIYKCDCIIMMDENHNGLTWMVEKWCVVS
jgi:hypothetical protein